MTGGVIFKRNIMGQDPQDPQDPAKPGNPGGNPGGNPDPNVIALQQKLTEKDRELKAAQAKLEELEKPKPGSDQNANAVAELQKTISELTGTIGTMTSEREKERLAKAYPDIVPDLLLGKSQEEIERLVKAQRETIDRNYQRLPSAHAPVFADRGEVEKEIEAVKVNKALSTDEKLQKIRELKTLRDEF